MTGDSDLSVGNIKSGVAIQGVTGQYPSSTYPLPNDTAATDLTSFASQLKTDGSFEFFDSAGARYTGSGDSDIVAAKTKTGVAFENLSVTGTYTWDCPTGWIKVPGDSAYGTNDFCTMKYEAKDVSSVPTSQASLVPFGTLNHPASVAACRALGTGYDLTSNPQWMTLAANVSGQNSNWTGGTVGSGMLFAGHSDNNPSATCAASTDDSLYYVETTCTNVNSGDTVEQRRTHTLSNGQVIWDLAGNASEFVNSINLNDKPGATNAFYEYSSLTGTTTTPLKDLIPTNAVKSYWQNTWNSAQRIGQFYPGVNGTGGYLLRGGHVNALANSGVYRVDLAIFATDTANILGFRCTLTSPPQ